jgi:hypothetical protein
VLLRDCLVGLEDIGKCVEKRGEEKVEMALGLRFGGMGVVVAFGTQGMNGGGASTWVSNLRLS